MISIPENFVGLTLYRTPDGRWQASATEDRLGWRVEIDADPVAALERVLGAAPTEDFDLEDLI